MDDPYTRHPIERDPPPDTFPFPCGAPQQVHLHAIGRLFRSVHLTPIVTIRRYAGSPDAARHATTAPLAIATDVQATNPPIVERPLARPASPTRQCSAGRTTFGRSARRAGCRMGFLVCRREGLWPPTVHQEGRSRGICIAACHVSHIPGGVQERALGPNAHSPPIAFCLASTSCEKHWNLLFRLAELRRIVELSSLSSKYSRNIVERQEGASG